MSIIQEVLSKGHLISPEAVPFLEENPNLVDDVDDSVLVITKDMIHKEEKLPTYKILYQMDSEESKKRLSDIAGFYNKRLEFLKGEIIKKVDGDTLVSVTNSKTSTNITVVGIVLETNGDGFVLEDNTGTIDVVSDGKVLEDTVVGVVGSVSGGKLNADSIIYPDIPIGKEVKTGSGKLLITRDVSKLDIPDDTKHICLIGDGEIEGVDLIRVNEGGLKVPAKLQTDDGLNVLLFGNEELDQRNSILHMRSRNMNPKLHIEGDPLLMREIPDILICTSGKDFFTNYKGLTLVSPGEKSYVIDYTTREITEL